VTRAAFQYVWRVRTRLPERFGARCRVLARGAMNSALVEFEDGMRVVTSRNYFRKTLTQAYARHILKQDTMTQTDNTTKECPPPKTHS
jgi:hypothetical protein